MHFFVGKKGRYGAVNYLLPLGGFVGGGGVSNSVVPYEELH